jgi:hypothetical protein
VWGREGGAEREKERETREKERESVRQIGDRET